MFDETPNCAPNIDDIDAGVEILVMDPVKVTKCIEEVDEEGWKQLNFKDKKSWKKDPLALPLIAYYIGDNCSLFLELKGTVDIVLCEPSILITVHFKPLFKQKL